MNKVVIILFVFVLASCATQNKVIPGDIKATEPFVIYKTKADYTNNVPVILNEDKTVVVSYPAPADLKNGDELRVPTSLVKGYLLDNKGISLNVAFTSYTYADYATMKNAPTIEELKNSIIDNDPLVELYDCREFITIKCDIKKLNKMVKRDLSSCVRLK